MCPDARRAHRRRRDRAGAVESIGAVRACRLGGWIVSRSPVNRSNVRFGDALAIGTYGLRSRRGRSALTALGIAIGIAAIVAVFGISSSSRADVLAQIDELGHRPADGPTRRRHVRRPRHAPGRRAGDDPPHRARDGGDGGQFVRRRRAAQRPDRHRERARRARRRDESPVDARRHAWPRASSSTTHRANCRWSCSGRSPPNGSGSPSLAGSPMVSIAGTPFTVVGILDPFPLHPDLDRAVMIGVGAAETVPRRRGDPDDGSTSGSNPSTSRTCAPFSVAPPNPAAPNEVEVSRPSDALEARARVDEGLQRLLIGLGAVALVVGGVGVANVMVISVLERRGEVGLRRALGAAAPPRGACSSSRSRRSCRRSAACSASALGAAATAWYANRQGWRLDVPLEVLGLSIVVALLLGVVAGLYPAIRAARLDPADRRPTDQLARQPAQHLECLGQRQADDVARRCRRCGSRARPPAPCMA